MSRIGKKPLTLPSGVTVTVAGESFSVKGPKGELSFPLPSGLGIEVKDNTATVQLKDKNDRQMRALFGLTRAELGNMVEGVTKGYERKLEVVGVGWNAKVQGKELVVQAGFCHTLNFEILPGLEVKCPSQTIITVNGMSKQLVGQFAAKVRASKPPEPYNGKGIKYDDEVIRRKAGKTFAATGA